MMVRRSRLGFSARLFVAVCLAGVVAAALWPCAAGGGEAAAPDTQAAAPTRQPQLDLSQDVPGWARYEVLGIELWQFLAAFVCVLLGLVLREVSDYLFARRIVPLLRRTPYEFDHLIAEAASKPVDVLLVLIGFFGAFAVLPSLVAGLTRL